MLDVLLSETVLALIALNVVFAQSFYITYMTGQLSFGHAAFATIGGYAAGLLTTRYGVPLAGAFLLAAGASFVAGIVVAVTALRTRYIYLAILTFGIMQVVTYGFEQWDFVGGVHGITGMFGVELPEVLAAAALAVAGTWWLERSRLGLAMRAVKRDEPVAALMGINTVGLRLLSFGLGSSVAGIAGALYGHYNFFIDPQTFGLGIAVNMVFFTIVGGTQVWVGPALGSIILTLVPEFLRETMNNVDMWRPAIYAAIIVAMLVVRPDGLVRRRNLLAFADSVSRLPPFRLFSPAAAPASLSSAAAPAYDMTTPGPDNVTPALELKGVSKSFGGVQAIGGASMSLPHGSIWGLIGPNGAGKTSLFNVVSGVYAPSAGTISVAGVDATRLSPTAVARMGVARTFQNIRLFGEMTVTENILVGQHRTAGTGLLPFAVGTRARERRLRKHCEFLLWELGLWDVRKRFAAELPYAMQRRVEIARALAMSPRVLLLDEPTAGMDPAESRQIVEVIRHVHRLFGLTVLLIEHDMSVVMMICDRITVLNFGRVIAEGTAAEVQADPHVREAYLGPEH